MDADLDTLCTAVYVTADDLLPARPGQRPAPGHRRRGGHPRPWPRRSWASPRTGAFCAVARTPARAPVPAAFPASPAYHKRRRRLRRDDRLAGRRLRRPEPRLRTMTWCCSTRPRSSAGARWRPSAARPWPTAAGYGWSRSHSRFFWGMRLHLVCALDGTPRRGRACAGADRPEREVALELLAAHPARRRDGGLPTRAMSAGTSRRAVAGLGGAPGAPRRARRAREPGSAWAAIRQRDRVGLPDPQGPAQRWSATAPAPPRACAPAIGVRLLALAASVWLNHQLGRPSRSLVVATWPERVESII